MALFNTTDIVDSSIYLKAKLKNNMVGDNYYIENLQAKRDSDWEYRYNVVDIEEELHKQTSYSINLPLYTPIEAVINSVKSDTGEDLGIDWASLSFKDLNHHNEIGSRYRFDYGENGGMMDLCSMSEEEKYYKTCVWLGINKSPIHPGNSLMVRRCNANIGLVGSPNRSYDNITEIRYEPVILESELKYISMYYNETITLPSAEWYLIMQLNYFTNFIKINDRFILGGVSLIDRANNTVFKVKSVMKSTSFKTFSELGSDEVSNVPLLYLALDRDLIDEADNFETRIANQCPIYVAPNEEMKDTPIGDYVITLSDPDKMRILLGEKMAKNVILGNILGEKVTKFTINAQFQNPDFSSTPTSYYIFQQTSENSFTIQNLKTCSEPVIVTCSCSNPDDTQQTLSQSFTFILGGFY